MKIYHSAKQIFSNYFLLLPAGLLLLFLTVSFSMTVHAADMGAVTAAPSNNGVGVVSCKRNGTPFTNYTYGASTDYITVSALPLNKEYNFLHWTDNGVIVSDQSTYSFSLGTKNHLVIAHFDQKSEYKGQRYHADKNISSLTRNTPTCDYASGYKIDGMALNTTLVNLDETSKAAAEALTGGSFVGAFRISFTFGYEGKAKEALDHKTRLVLQLFQKQSGTCYVTSFGENAPTILEDLDAQPDTVTFETAKSGTYVITARPDNMPAAPTAEIANAPIILPAPDPSSVSTPAVTVPAATVPAAADSITSTPAVPSQTAIIPTAPGAAANVPVSEAEYQESIITILRYQLQQAGLTPAA